MSEEPHSSTSKINRAAIWFAGAIWVVVIAVGVYSGDSVAEISKMAIGSAAMIAVLYFAGVFIDALLSVKR